jgi:hypothetical protein
VKRAELNEQRSREAHDEKRPAASRVASATVAMTATDALACTPEQMIGAARSFATAASFWSTSEAAKCVAELRQHADLLRDCLQEPQTAASLVAALQTLQEQRHALHLQASVKCSNIFYQLHSVLFAVLSPSVRYCSRRSLMDCFCFVVCVCVCVLRYFFMFSSFAKLHTHTLTHSLLVYTHTHTHLC